ncbi:HigA family addiction module antidote protein [Rhizobiales bacterium]|uniref:HigA family addiction module antitoxin n=1 Tax=Hongsoonwoonella zoysiae TaxID=2821844 RepID=UPI0015615F8C|nr:HigA family addiction module antitoxin [Hongsoonwoonella zoysiae]NRG19403.1 HigA family addiction module antidote protein [Hongsoonwoonella zoysiae]
MTRERRLPPMHPGEVLREEFMEPHGLSAYAVAKACHIPRTRIERIVREETGITTDTALRLAKYFGTTPEFWLNLQNRYEMETTEPQIRADLEMIETCEMEDACGGLSGG